MKDLITKIYIKSYHLIRLSFDWNYVLKEIIVTITWIRLNLTVEVMGWKLAQLIDIKSYTQMIYISLRLYVSLLFFKSSYRIFEIIGL